jgi:hypothetical protein
MRKHFLAAIAALLVGLAPVAIAQQKSAADPLPPQSAPPDSAASGKDAQDKGNDAGAKAESKQNQRDAIKSRRDHRRTVTHRLRRRV